MRKSAVRENGAVEVVRGNPRGRGNPGAGNPGQSNIFAVVGRKCCSDPDSGFGFPDSRIRADSRAVNVALTPIYLIFVALTPIFA